MSRLSEPVSQQVWETTLKKAAAALRDADVPFAIMGSVALWARSGKRPSTTEDIDFALREVDIVRAARALADAGFRVEVPEESWLVKAWSPEELTGHEALFVDLIYAPAGVVVDDELLERADLAPVLALDMLVLSATDLMTTKLMALNQQRLDYISSMEMARILREQVDWDELERQTCRSPYAEAFFLLSRRLGIDPRTPAEERSEQVLQFSSRPTLHSRYRAQLIEELRTERGRETRQRRTEPAGERLGSNGHAVASRD